MVHVTCIRQDNYIRADPIRGFIYYIKNIVEINLLPYHRAGEGKYIKYGKENKMNETGSPDEEHMENIKQLFSKLKLKVKIGG